MAKYPIRTITQVMSSVNSIFLRTSLSVPLESCAPIQALASVLHGQLPSWGHATNSFHSSLSWYVSLMKYSQFSHSVVSDSVRHHGLQHTCRLSITNCRSLPKLMSIESVMPSNHLILCWPLLLPPSIFPSIRVFSNESVLHIKWPKYWSFSFSISPSNEHSGLIPFRMDWLDLLAVQGTLESLLQHHSSKASILRHSAFFIVHLSHPYMTTGKPQLWLDRPLLAK